MLSRLRWTLVLLFAASAFPVLLSSGIASAIELELPKGGFSGLSQPTFVYCNWAAYDELSDNVPLDEPLAMKQLNEILRLRQAGVQIDYYLMDAFWFGDNSAYREWKKPNWPDGPDRWLAACKEHGLKPGLWFATNMGSRDGSPPEWATSLDEQGGYCLFDGGFLPGFMDTLQYWYDRGFRLFKFDFARFGAATPAAKKQYETWEIRDKNAEAFRNALTAFRKRNPEVLFVAFNGFGGDYHNTTGPMKQVVDPRWLDALDTLYCGDPRPSDVPAMSFWRSCDIYTDHMVRYYELNGIPLERIDNTGFMIGNTGTCYRRNLQGWKGAMVLLFARGGWMNVIYGDLSLLSDADAKWFAKAQALYHPLQAFGRTHTFGGLPGKSEAYGFASVNDRGGLYTVVNPSQSVQTLKLPSFHPLQPPVTKGRILFSDAGAQPVLNNDSVKLRPEQLAVVGFGEYARRKYGLGLQQDVVVPSEIEKVAATFAASGKNQVTATLPAPPNGDLRIIMRQTVNGMPHRVSGGKPSNGKTLDKLLSIRVRQGATEIPLRLGHDKFVWSGLSWGVAEASSKDLNPDAPIIIECTSTQPDEMDLDCEVFRVRY